MSFEKFTLYTKKEVSPVDRGSDDGEIIANVLQHIKAEGVIQTEIPKQPHELDPGKPRHEVHNDPRQLPKPTYAYDVSPDSTVPPKPPKTL